jgi:membrane-bound lytic murein transglycosylase A
VSNPSFFKESRFDELPGWADDDQLAAFSAFRRCADHVLSRPYRTGALGIECSAFAEAHAEAHAAHPADSAGARAFFERHFIPLKVRPDTGGGLVTGFYEPEVEASPIRTARFTVPLLARPADLVDVDDANRPPGMDPYLAFARATPDGLVEYFDRREIERGALAGKAAEIAWLADKVDAFFIHVQGAARLTMSDGRLVRVTYAAKSGQRFSGPGQALADLGEIPLQEVTMQSIRAWFRLHPERVDEILWRNRSYIFFRQADVSDPALGPIAAAKVPLTAGRSMAVDRLLHTFGTPFYVDAPQLTAFGGAPFRRLMIAQDTGSAITGPARGDLFAGSGDAAGEIAGVVRHAADFFALVPRRLAPRLLAGPVSGPDQ